MSGLCISNSLLNVPEEFLREYNETYVTEKHRTRYSYQISWLKDVNKDGSEERKHIEDNIHQIEFYNPWNSLKGLKKEDIITLMYCINFDKLKQISASENKETNINITDNFFQILEKQTDNNSNIAAALTTNVSDVPEEPIEPVAIEEPVATIYNDTKTPAHFAKEAAFFDTTQEAIQIITSINELKEKIEEADEMLTMLLYKHADILNNKGILYTAKSLHNSFRMYRLYADEALTKKQQIELVLSQAKTLCKYIDTPSKYNIGGKKSSALKTINEAFDEAIDRINSWDESGLVSGFEYLFYEALENLENIRSNIFKKKDNYTEQVKGDISFLKNTIQAISNNADSISKANKEGLVCIRTIAELYANTSNNNKEVQEWLESIADDYKKRFNLYLNDSVNFSRTTGKCRNDNEGKRFLSELKELYPSFNKSICKYNNIVEELKKNTQKYLQIMKQLKDNNNSDTEEYKLNFKEYNLYLQKALEKEKNKEQIIRPIDLSSYGGFSKQKNSTYGTNDLENFFSNPENIKLAREYYKKNKGPLKNNGQQ